MFFHDDKIVQSNKLWPIRMMEKIKAEEIEKIQTLPKSFQREEMLEMFWMNRFLEPTGFEPRERE